MKKDNDINVAKQKAVAITADYMKSNKLSSDDFTIELLSVKKKVGKIVLHEGDDMSRFELYDEARVHLGWKQRDNHLRGGDGQSRDLLIDLTHGQVIKVIRPR